MGELRDTLDAIDEAAKEALFTPYLEAMKINCRAMWDKGRAIVEVYPDVKDGKNGPRGTGGTGGGVPPVISYRFVSDETGRDHKQIKKWVSLARKYPTIEQAQIWVEQRAAELADRYCKRLGGAQRLLTPPLPEGKFGIIYADPPWNLNDYRPPEWGEYRETHYQAMDTQQICELGVKEIRGEPSVLFLWATSPMIQDALRVINGWGFDYKAQFVWDKVKHNLGHYNSVRHELLLIATKGSMPPEVPERKDSVISIPRSDLPGEKPEEFAQIIDVLYPSGKALAMWFAGCQYFGRRWTVWGLPRLRAMTS